MNKNVTIVQVNKDYLVISDNYNNALNKYKTGDRHLVEIDGMLHEFHNNELSSQIYVYCADDVGFRGGKTLTISELVDIMLDRKFKFADCKYLDKTIYVLNYFYTQTIKFNPQIINEDIPIYFDDLKYHHQIKILSMMGVDYENRQEVDWGDTPLAIISKKS